MVSDSKIHIALTFDDNFWAPAYATMRSICLHTKRRSDLVFHLCHRPLSEKHFADLKLIEDEFGSETHFYAINDSEKFKTVVSELPYNNRLTNIVYARLLFDHILPSNVERLIYLDCDMMVMAPIEKLWETDLEGKTIGAVDDPWGPFISTGRDFRQNKDLCDPADFYFNAGLLLIDMKRWKQADISEKIARFTASGIMNRIYYDQGFLNIVFRDDFKSLDTRWNIIGPSRSNEPYRAFNLHYTGKQKPWALYANVAFFRMYRHVMTNEIFYDFFWHRQKQRVRKALGRIGIKLK